MPTAPYLRASLLPGLVDIARRNLSRGLTDLALFEQGSVFLPEPGTRYGSGAAAAPAPRRPTDECSRSCESSIPPQPLHVGALFLGNVVAKQPGQNAIEASLTDALQAVRADRDRPRRAHRRRPGARTRPSIPGRTAELSVGGQPVGFAGELLPALAHELDLPRRVVVVEVDLGLLIDLAPREVVPTPIGKSARRDAGPVAGGRRGRAGGEVLDAVVSGAGELLESAQLVDDYRGSGVPAGTKSLTFALRFRAADRTLTAAEASGAKLAGAELAGARFGATVRE